MKHKHGTRIHDHEWEEGDDHAHRLAMGVYERAEKIAPPKARRKNTGGRAPAKRKVVAT